jgi:hypothetical protein
MKSKLFLIFLVGLMPIILMGCFPGEGNYSESEPAGFFTAIWHGWIAPVSLVIGLFNHTTRIYELHNVGWWYDFGFYIAVIGGFGSIALFRKRKHKRQKTE